MGSWPLTPINGGVADYSTTPVKTGQKWIDGKDIYRVVLIGTVNGLTYIQIPDTGIDTVVNFSVISYLGQFLTSTFYGGNVSNLCVSNIDKISSRVIINNQIVAFNGSAVHVIIDYTKN